MISNLLYIFSSNWSWIHENEPSEFGAKYTCFGCPF